MLDVLALIESRKQEFTNLPLFTFMQDQNLHPRERLSFAPCMAHFIMSFSDLNQYVFLEKQPLNKIQCIINQHAYEDEEHWSWYLKDIEKLQLNSNINLTQGLRLVWNEETKITRQITYQIAGYSYQAIPEIKLIVLEALESVGHVFFKISAKVASELRAISNQDYFYFGDAHLRVETGHAMRTPEAEDYVAKIELTHLQRQQAIEIVEKIFQIFTEWTYELLAYAQKHGVESLIENDTEAALMVCT
ncbi:hypothetical protein Riv7116_4292 [Rivularia sp. PCC 7116]|uniref:hypothetical protein n=1 Tax=Rivularia sp. PCC 7116 TaxID=373994 RepID=UPI00029F39CB|nr:hypothetical protein [Rivularia sp. PCC 7116]AFY56721.1 hypothetical protein Riv7116_4292 [Rivularia sp. PCC 7116]